MADERNPANAVFGLNDARMRSSAPSESASQQYYAAAPPGTPAARSATPTVVTVLLTVLVLVAGVTLYLTVSGQHRLNDQLAKQADELEVLTHRMDASDQRYAQLSGEFRVTAQRLGLTQQELNRARALASDIQRKQQEAVAELNNAIAQKASAETVNKLQADANAKIGGLTSDVADINKKLGETNQALNGAKGELSGAIARTHDELVALAHRTDRDYFEFTLASRGARQKVGNVMIELTKTNPKRNQYSVNLYFDDKRTERKDKALDEPVTFYMQGAPSPLELVVNKIGKNSVSGYLSAPKGFFANTPNVLSARPGV